MIRLSKKLLLLQNLKELGHAGLDNKEWQRLVDQYAGGTNIIWDFDQAFYDESDSKITLIGRNKSQPKNDEFSFTITLKGAGKKRSVSHYNIDIP